MLLTLWMGGVTPAIYAADRNALLVLLDAIEPQPPDFPIVTP
ncbi:MAG: hypothetical protein WAO76_18650 [Georgfuchsia sp.]